MPEDKIEKRIESQEGPQIEVPSAEVLKKLEEGDTAAKGEHQPEEKLSEGIVPASKAAQATPMSAVSGQSQKVPDPTYEAVEDILEEDLEEVYFKMDEKHKKEFKIKGEETTGAIAKMLKAAQATTKKVLGLIRGWLKVIPGVNKFFLEQEAKIKADEIMELEAEIESKIVKK